jgi:tetratricopeptide (TPR) repeat protein
MKKGLLLLVSSFLVIASMAQSEKYVKAMESKVALLDSSRTAENFKELANGFERIAEAEKTQWMPYYYAAYCQVMAGTFSMPQDGSFGDNSSISDPYADKAEQLINKADELSKENSEIYCVKKMVFGLRMMGNPMSRYMTEGAKASEALEKAKALNSNNPRIYILEGQDKFYTPEQFGGSKEEAKKLFEKANGIFMVSKPGSSIEPQWGRGQVGYFLSMLK